MLFLSERLFRASVAKKMENGGSGRVYVGSLPGHFSEKDIYREFETFGPILKVELKKAANGTGYAFIEYQDARDARDAIAQLHGRPPPGEKDAAPLRVELPNNRREMGRGGGGPGPRIPSGAKRGDYILEIAGLPPTGSWQDLKDHFRVCGDVGYADVWGGGDPDAPRFGEVSFFSRRDMLDALERLDGSTFRSHQNEKSRISVREKRSNPMGDDHDDDRAGGRGYPPYGGGYSRGGDREPMPDRRMGYGGGYSRSHRSPSPRGGDDYYPPDRSYRRPRSRSRERRGHPEYTSGGSNYAASSPPLRHRDDYGGPPAPRRYDDRDRV